MVTVLGLFEELWLTTLHCVFVPSIVPSQNHSKVLNTGICKLLVHPNRILGEGGGAVMLDIVYQL